MEDMINLEYFYFKEKWLIIDWFVFKVIVGFKKLVSGFIKIEVVLINWI